MAKEELIVFVDEQGEPTGETGPKLASHHGDTKLHLAFSSYIFNRDGKLLVTQRTHTKKVWPGVWTNSCCGHPMPGEKIEDAIHRRAAYELGMKVGDITCLLPNYTYKTKPFNGIIEYEFCPVFVALAKSDVKPNPDEVEAFEWSSWPDFVLRLEQDPKRFSHWAKEQTNLLNNSTMFNSFLSNLSR